MNESMDPPHTSVSISDDVCTITLNRPDKRNSISVPMLDGIDAGLDHAFEQSARVVVIRGSGGNFCAGADLSYVSGLLDQSPERFEAEFLPRVQSTMNGIEDCTLPVIAAVEGYCLAGGFELALCCDIVVAARTAQMGDGHSVYGFLPGSGGAYRLARKVGTNNAKFLAFTGDPVPATEMAAMGVVSQIFDAAEFDTGVASLARKLTRRSPLGLRRMKGMIDSAPSRDRAAGLMAERLASAAHVGSHDMKEGLAAFREKRTPRFQGR